MVKKILSIGGVILVGIFILWALGRQYEQCLADGHDRTYCSALMNTQLNGNRGVVVVESDR